MKNDFAKLFESEKYGQICVLKKNNENDEPEIHLHFKPDGLGVCGIGFSMGSGDDDTSYDRQDKAWEIITLESCESELSRYDETIFKVSSLDE